MKILFCVLFIQPIFFSPLIYSQFRDSLVNVIYLKDGTVVKGTIIETKPGKTITIRTSEGMIYKYDFKKDIEDMDLEIYKIEQPKENDTDKENEPKEKVVESNTPKNTFGYFSLGMGIPQIAKFGLGWYFGIYNFGLGLGFNFGAMYFKPNEMGMLKEMIDFFFKFYFPKLQGILTPYVSISGGGAFFAGLLGGAPPGYNAYYLGTLISVESWLQVSPEMGLVHTSVSENKTSFGFNIALEIIF